MSMRRSLLTTASILHLLTLPCQAGPCTSDIESMQFILDAKVNTAAAAGPDARQGPSAGMHRQPTPAAKVEAAVGLGDVKPETVKKVRDAMTRARKADAAGNKKGCDSALADAKKAAGL